MKLIKVCESIKGHKQNIMDEKIIQFLNIEIENNGFKLSFYIVYFKKK